MDESTESFRNYVRRFRNSPQTKKTYTDWLRRFVWYSNLPEVKAKLGLDVDIGDNTDLLLFDDTRKIQNHIKQYLDYQYEVMHISPRSASSYYIAVKHFYESNEVTLNWHVMKDYVGVGSSSMTNVSANLDMPMTYEEFHRLLEKCDERKRVIILLLCSSGIRRGAVPELKVGDLKWIEEYGIYEITVYKGFKEEYKTFCSLECASAIRSYLDYRERHNEKITADSYLIRKQFDIRAKHKISDATDPPHKHKVSMKNVESMIYRLIYESGIRSYDERKTRLGDRHKNMMTHSFRKFFENKCLEAGIDPFYVSVLMRHKAGIGVERHYYRPDSINGEYSLLELYVKKAMPYLTISDEQRLKLKNRELEIRMKEDEERFKRAIEEHVKQKDNRLTVIESQIKTLLHSVV